MREINTTARIIGDSLELYSDIRNIKYDKNDKRPKFIKNLLVKRYTNKLIKIVNRIRDADKALNKDNLMEFFIYMYNNYPPKGTYKNTAFVKILDNMVFSLYEFENIHCRFTLREDADKFNLLISVKDAKTDTYKNFDINLDELYSDNKNQFLVEIVEKINKSILNDITDYILDIINSMKGVTGNDV